MRRGLAWAAAGAAIALSFAPLFTTPASAQGAVTLTADPISMTPAPGPAGNVFSNNLAVTGRFRVDGGFQPTIDWISVNLTWRGPAPGPQVPGPFTMCGPKPPSGPPGPACGNDFSFKDRPLAPAPAYNGPYRINATAHASDQITGGQDEKGTPNNLDFNLVAPPPNVTAVTATVDKNRNVSVSWDRDAATPDVQSYWVYREGPGDKAFTAVAQVPQLTTGARVTFVDEGKYLGKGGDYVYQIEERRNGTSGDGSTSIASVSRTASNKVTVAPPPPGQTVPPTTAPKGGGAPPIVKGTPSGVNRNSGFSGSGSSSATTPTSIAVTPDPGYVHGLPDAGGATPGSDNSSEGDNSAVAVTPGRHSSSNRGILVPIAGAGVLLLGALHLRILKKRLDEPPGSGLTPVA